MRLDEVHIDIESEDSDHAFEWSRELFFYSRLRSLNSDICISCASLYHSSVATFDMNAARRNWRALPLLK